MMEQASRKGNLATCGGQQCTVSLILLLTQEANVEDIERMEKLEKLLDKLKGEWVFVEGLKDKEALSNLGFRNIMTISGNLRQSCRKVDADKVFVLTDLDRRGDQLAGMAKDELESNSIRADLEARKKLAFLLRIRFFEDAYRAYEELKGEIYG